MEINLSSGIYLPVVIISSFIGYIVTLKVPLAAKTNENAYKAMTLFYHPAFLQVEPFFFCNRTKDSQLDMVNGIKRLADENSLHVSPLIRRLLLDYFNADNDCIRGKCATSLVHEIEMQYEKYSVLFDFPLRGFSYYRSIGREKWSYIHRYCFMIIYRLFLRKVAPIVLGVGISLLVLITMLIMLSY